MILDYLSKISAKIKFFLEQNLLFPTYKIYLMRYHPNLSEKKLRALCNFNSDDKFILNSWFSASNFFFFFNHLELGQEKKISDVDEVLRKADEICNNLLYIMDDKKIYYGLLKVWNHDNVNDYKHFSNYYKLTKFKRSANIVDALLAVKLNRHPFLFILAKAYFYSGDEKYAKKAFSLILDWIEKNPVGIGLGWFDALNASFRSISWIWTLEFLKNSKVFELNFEEILKGLILHARYIKKNLSLRQFPNNHLIGDVCGLFHLSLFLNPLKESSENLKTAKSILETEIINQFYPDGGNKEHAFQYARLSSDFCLQAYIIGKKNGIVFSEAYEDRLKKIYDFFLETLTSDFIIPNIGDGEDSVVDRLSEIPKRNPIPLLATLSLLFKDEIEDFINEMPVETYFLLGNEGYEKFKKAKRTHKIFGSTILPDTGLCVMRSGSLKEGLHLFFDVGPQGLGDSGHGHADSLNIVVYAHGNNLLVDPGTYIYNANHDWRNYFKGTSAHNTVRVDSQDQAVPYSYDEPFGWKEKADGYLSNWSVGKFYDFASGYHKGYMRLKDGVLHNRAIFFNKRQGYWLILDNLTGKGEHLFDLFYHLHPKMKIETSDSNSVCASFEDGTGIKIILLNDVNVKKDIIFGETKPIQGWFSSEYNSKEPASVVRYSKKGTTPENFHTIILPFVDRKRIENKFLVEVIRSDKDYRVYSIKHDTGLCEKIVISFVDDKKITFECFESDASFLFYSKDPNSQIVDIYAVNSSYIFKDGKTLISNYTDHRVFEKANLNGPYKF
jgi:hypothetical protein